MFRIKKYPKGYVVEIQKTKWYGKKYWTHFISVAGIKEMPWYFETHYTALSGLMSDIRKDVNNNS